MVFYISLTHMFSYSAKFQHETSNGENIKNPVFIKYNSRRLTNFRARSDE